MDIIWLVPAAGIVAILFAAMLARDVLSRDADPAMEIRHLEGQTGGQFGNAIL